MPHLDKLDYDITYPPGVKELTDELSTEELVKRLKICANVLQNLGQNDNVSCYENFALHIASEEFLTHISKEVRLLVACILVDIFRLFAPDPPYKEPFMIKNIFFFLVEELKGIKNPLNVYFKRHFYILEILAWLKAFNICFDIEEGPEIFCILFKLFFNSINENHSSKVKNYMLDIMSSVLFDIDNIPNELLETILLCIIEPYKSQKREAYSLAKDLLKRTDKILEPYIQQYFTSVLFPEKDKDATATNDIGNQERGAAEVDLNEEAGEQGDDRVIKKTKLEVELDANGENVDGTNNNSSSTIKKVRKNRIELQAKKYRDARVYDFIYELYNIMPNLLINVVPLLEFKLKSDKNDDRMSVIKALGRMFSDKDSNLANENPALWKSFLGRFNDIDVNVRLICVRYVSHLLINHNNSLYSADEIDMPSELADSLLARAYDPEESVRLELVNSLVQVGTRSDQSTLLFNQNIINESAATDMVTTSLNVLDDHDNKMAMNQDTTSPSTSLPTEYKCPLILNLESGASIVGCEGEKLLECLKSRTLDKKFRIRKEAMMGIGTIYKMAYAISNTSESCCSNLEQRRKLFWIRDQIMHSYYQNTTEDQILVERVFNTCLVPFNLTARKKMYRLLHFFVNIDEYSVKALTELWKKHFILRSFASQYVDLKLKQQSLKTDTKDIFEIIRGDDHGVEKEVEQKKDPSRIQASLLFDSGNFEISHEAESKAKTYRDKVLQRANDIVKAEISYIGLLPPRSNKKSAPSTNDNTLPTTIDQTTNKLYQISKMLTEPLKAFENLKKFDEILSKDAKLLKNFQSLVVNDDITCKEACQLCKTILKKMGNHQATNVLYTSMKQFLERVAPLMIDRESIHCLCEILHDIPELLKETTTIHPFYENFLGNSLSGDSNPSSTTVSAAATTSKSYPATNNKAKALNKQSSTDELTKDILSPIDVIKDRGFRLLQIISCVFVNAFYSPEILRYLNGFIDHLPVTTKETSSQNPHGTNKKGLKKSCPATVGTPPEDSSIVNKSTRYNLQILTNIMKHWTIQQHSFSLVKNTRISSRNNELLNFIVDTIIPHLIDLCRSCDHKNYKDTKYAVNALLSIVNHPSMLNTYYNNLHDVNVGDYSLLNNNNNNVLNDLGITESLTFKEHLVNDLYQFYVGNLKKPIHSESFLNALTGLAQMFLLYPSLTTQTTLIRDILPVMTKTFNSQNTSTLLTQVAKTNSTKSGKGKAIKGSKVVEMDQSTTTTLQEDSTTRCDSLSISLILNGSQPVSQYCQANVSYIKFRCKLLMGYLRATKHSKDHQLDVPQTTIPELIVPHDSPSEVTCKKSSSLNNNTTSPNTLPSKTFHDLIKMTKEFYGLLFKSCIDLSYTSFRDPKNKQNKFFSRELTPNEYIFLKLKSACAVFKLVQTPLFWECLTSEQYQSLAYLLKEIPHLEFKQRYIFKLHKALLSLKLPLEYLAIFCLVANPAQNAPPSPDQREFKLRCKQYLLANVTKRREILRTNPITLQNKVNAILPDYVLPFAIHLLAHAPDFTDIGDVKYLESIKESLWFLIEPLIHKNENYSFSFFKRLIENIKQTKDAQTPNDSQKLYAVCDIALGLILTRSSNFMLKDYPAKPILPSKLFIKANEDDAFNARLYLPPAYVFSPPRRKVTRPELCQFFSLATARSDKKTTPDASPSPPDAQEPSLHLNTDEVIDSVENEDTTQHDHLDTKNPRKKIKRTILNPTNDNNESSGEDEQTETSTDPSTQNLVTSERELRRNMRSARLLSDEVIETNSSSLNSSNFPNDSISDSGTNNQSNFPTPPLSSQEESVVGNKIIKDQPKVNPVRTRNKRHYK